MDDTGNGVNVHEGTRHCLLRIITIRKLKESSQRFNIKKKENERIEFNLQSSMI